ncbi:hypothetical protein GCM10022419_068620 [Nonomuraea rosea]|uniref:Lipid droplet-associated protein n=1 Tax=Nonomuraea rosea TaxID=638574 RepID=A0ABP6Y735_9ACTN
MSLSDVIRNIAKTVTNKDELKEKAKDLPLLVVQTTLSAAGQALLLVDRMKNSIKGLGSKEKREEEYDSRPSAAEQVAAPAAEEDKPARKEPVIFAPRPSAAEPNGTAKTTPDPVIFAPTGKTDAAATAEPEAAAAPAPAPAKAEPIKAEPAKTEPAKTETSAEAEAAAPAKPAAKTKAKTKAAAKTAAPVVEEQPSAAPEATAAPEPAAAPEPTAAPEPAAAPEPTAAPEPVSSAPVDLVEPLPGYSELTVASLRARMRGKSAEQIGDFLAFERSTAARPEVIKMFENRLAKLQAEG